MRRLLLVLLLAACTAEKPVKTEAPKPATPAPPSAAQARDLIANSSELGEHEFTSAGWTAPVAGSSMSAPVRAEAHDLAAAGWIAIDENGDVSLNAKSRSDKRFLLRPNGLLDVVPLAKKEMGDILTVEKTEDGMVGVDFKWKWVPNEVGAAFRTGPVHDRLAAPHQSRAALMWDGTGWMVLKIQ
jgi:hypothetical protein